MNNNDNGVTFNPPYIKPEQFETKPYNIGTIGSLITQYELYSFGLYLKDLEKTNLNSEAMRYLLGVYTRILNRAENRNGELSNVTKEITRLNKVIDNTLHDLEAIYKETGLDSVGVLIKNVKDAR